jgi:hypothetical protein
MEGKGFWEDEFTEKAKLIPGVNSKIAAEIGTDLKYRLMQSPRTWYDPFSRSLPYSLNISRKAKLVKEALDKVKELSDDYNRQQRASMFMKPRKITSDPRVTQLLTPQQFYETRGRVTGRLGQEVQRTLPQRYPELTNLTYAGDIFSDNNTVLAVTNIRNNRRHLRDGIKQYDLTYRQPISFGRYNTIIVLSKDHAGVLFKKLTDPVSYEFYDAHGLRFDDPRSDFYPYRARFYRIIRGSPVTFNAIRHQNYAGLCVALSMLRASRPDLTNQEYHDDLQRVVTNIVNNPQSNVENQETFFIHNNARGPANPLNRIALPTNFTSRQRILQHINQGPDNDLIPVEGEPSDTSYADVVVAPFVVNSVLNRIAGIPDIDYYGDD